MNIIDAIKMKGLEQDYLNGKTLNLRDSGITSLEGFKQIGKLDLTNNQITNIDRFRQENELILVSNRLTVINEFVQYYKLDISNNMVCYLDGIDQNAELVAKYNPIIELKDFEQNDLLYLCKWNTVYNDSTDELTIGCYTKHIKEWKKWFVDSRNQYETPRTSKEFNEIEKAFMLYYKRFMKDQGNCGYRFN